MKKIFTKFKEIFWPEKVQTRSVLQYPNLDENIAELTSFVNKKGAPPLELSKVYCLIGCTARLLAVQDGSYNHSNVLMLSDAVELLVSEMLIKFNKEHGSTFNLKSYFKGNRFACQDFSIDLSLMIVFDIVNEDQTLRTGFKFKEDGTSMHQEIKVGDFTESIAADKAPYYYDNFFNFLFSQDNIDYLNSLILTSSEIIKQ